MTQNMTQVTARTEPYHLSAGQVSFFDDNGYLIVRDAIRGPLLTRLQDATARLIDEGKAADPHAETSQDYKFVARSDGPHLMRINYLHAKGKPTTLELLGSPVLLGIAESLAGHNFVPTYEALVFKDENDGAAVNWHQDAVHPRRFRIFNIDLYLDASRRGAGALRVIPGSQRNRIDACDLEERHGWNPPGVIQVEMEPGDVLVHDVMVVHGSEPTTGNRLRRTIYYEFRPAEQIVTEGPWDREWIGKRLRLMRVALAEYARQNGDHSCFTWNVSEAYRPAPALNSNTELRVAHTVHSPSAYCSAGDVT